MKKCIPLFLLLLSAFGLYAQATSSPKAYPAKKLSNYTLTRFDVREAYQLSAKETIVIAHPTKPKPGEEGLRLLYLVDKGLRYQSKGAGDSYIYDPTFFQFSDSTLLILCETGTEYSWGADVYELSHKKMKLLGNLNLAGDNEEAAVSIIPQTKIARKGKDYVFTFTGKVVVDSGEEKEKIVNGNTIQATYQEAIGKLVVQKR